MPYDVPDYTNRYNTPLSPLGEQAFQSWVADQSKRTGRNVANDLYDYDLRGWWNNNQTNADLDGAHLADDYKKPNHPTFSTQSQWHGVGGMEGGQWQRQSDGSWSFAPGTTNMRIHGADALQDYFGRVEPGNRLVLPSGGGAASMPQPQPFIDPNRPQWAAPGYLPTDLQKIGQSMGDQLTDPRAAATPLSTPTLTGPAWARLLYDLGRMGSRSRMGLPTEE